jgi:hypothetical protein
MKFLRYRRPSLNTLLGITGAVRPFRCRSECGWKVLMIEAVEGEGEGEGENGQ